jgi:hypothetical protein
MGTKYPGNIVTSGAAAGYSVAFGGTSGFLTSATNAAFTFGTGDFTVEFWCYPISSTGPGGYSYLYAQGPNTTAGFGIYFDGSVFKVWNSSAVISGTTTRSTSNWYHVAVSRSGTSMRLFVNGVQDGSTATNSSNITTGTTYGANIGRWVEISDANYLVGNISNLRVIKGTALYTTTFTPPTQLFAITNTSLLTCQSPTILDNSSNAFAITVNGNAAVSTFSPFPGYQAYNPALGASTPGVWTVSDAIQARQTRRWNMYDPYFQNTTLLLHGNGTNGAQNNTFLDSSTNNFTITRNGNTTQGTFSPFSQTGWSNYFPGTSSDFEEVSLSSIANYAGDLTIECWFCLAGTPTGTAFNTSYYLIGAGSSNANPGLDFAVGDTAIWFNQADYGSRTLSGTWTPNRNWNHIAVTRSSNSWTMWLNGVSIATATSSTAVSSTVGTAAIGRCEPTGGDGSGSMLGYISNLRVTKNCVYTNSFTPPTAALTKNSGGQNPPSAAQTVALICQSNRFVDNSDNALTVTPKGSVSVQAFSPFAPTAAYSAATNGGSGYFDGTGDYLTVSDNTALEFGSGAFTIEAWVYVTATPGASGAAVLSKTSATYPGGYEYNFVVQNDRKAFFGFYTTAQTDLVGTTALPLNAWAHIAVSRSGNNFALFVNGTREATNTGGGTIQATSSNLFIGDYGGGSRTLTGYISGARIVKGTAVYDPTVSTLTIPTAPPTAVTNTSFLANFTNAGITDATAKNDLETVGNAQISTTQSKFGGSSMSFDGTGDYLVAPASVLNNVFPADVTIECWVYFNSVSNSPHIWNIGTSASNRMNLYLSSSKLNLYSETSVGTGTNKIIGTTTLSTGQWYYIALVKSGSTFTLYLNGSSEGTSTTTVYPNASNLVALGFNNFGSASGDYLNGYIDDFRITRFARYTANFTPQTSQWQDQ